VIGLVIGVVIEPMMGALSDKVRDLTVSHFPFIFVSVILSSTLFIVLPSIVTFLEPSEVTRWIFLFVAVSWALAMTVFRSPAIA
jgi:Na+/melibiose symporter-like transporter